MRRIALWILATLVASPAFALTDEEVFRDFRFNFINPGARALGLAGAFVSVADDATAAQSNPAGLAYLRNWEFFAEYRYVDNGATSQTLSETLPAGIQTVVATGTDPADLGTPSFLSFVYPVVMGRWTLGVSRHVVLDVENSTVNRFAFDFTSPPGVFLVEGSGFIDVQSVRYNLSAGYRPNDELAFGVSLSYSTLHVASSVENLIVDTGGTVAGEPIYEPTLDLRTFIDDTDEAIGFNLGVVWRPIVPVRFGAVYRRSPKFEVTEIIDAAVDDDEDGEPDSGIDTGEKRALFGCDPFEPCAFGNRFSFPDSLAVSVGWDARDNLTIVQDFEYIRYSDLLDGYVGGLNILTSEGASFTVDDAVEYHFGAEYLLLKWPSAPVALRAGIFTDRDSTIRATATGDRSFATSASFPGRDDQVHVTAGGGIVWGQGRFKVDVAADFANSDNEYLVSFIIRGK